MGSHAGWRVLLCARRRATYHRCGWWQHHQYRRHFRAYRRGRTRARRHRQGRNGRPDPRAGQGACAQQHHGEHRRSGFDQHRARLAAGGNSGRANLPDNLVGRMGHPQEIAEMVRYLMLHSGALHHRPDHPRQRRRVHAVAASPRHSPRAAVLAPVMAGEAYPGGGQGPAIHDFVRSANQIVDGRHKPGLWRARCPASGTRRREQVVIAAMIVVQVRQDDVPHVRRFHADRLQSDGRGA